MTAYWNDFDESDSAVEQPSCATRFGLTSNPGAFNPTIQISSTQTQVYNQFLGKNSACTTPPANVILTAIASGGVSTTYTFPLLGKRSER